MMMKQTGTTIVGLKYNDGVVLCADTRSTMGPFVANKNTVKIHKITPQIFACGAGTSADTIRVSRMASKELLLFQRKYQRVPRVSHCVRTCMTHLHAYQGGIGAALIIGGVDDEGIHLYDVYPHGSFNSLSYTAVGSGSLAAISILENKFKNLEMEEAIQLGCEAIQAGILNDLYSGSNIDVCVINKEETKYIRNYAVISKRSELPNITYPRDSVRILKEDVFKYVEEI